MVRQLLLGLTVQEASTISRDHRAGLKASSKAFEQYGVAVAVGVLAAWLLYPGWYFIGSLPGDTSAPGDVAQHIISQRYFFADSWHWPVTRTLLLLPPHGVNIALTDGIPLEALILKLFAPLLPARFEGITVWACLAAIAQPVAAVFALRGVPPTRLPTALAASVLAVAMPLQPLRFYHAALSTHAVLLIAIGLYIRVLRHPSRRTIALAAVVPAVALAVHPYLAAMVLAVLGVIPLTLVLRRDPAAWFGWVGLLASLAICAAVAGLLGYFGDTLEGTGGFGQNPLPILSWIIPSMSTLFGGATVDGLADVHAGQSQYLGAGLLALAVAAMFVVFRQRGELARLAKRHAALAALCISLFIFSILNHIRLIDSTILTIPIPYFILRHLDQFRANDRFSWPVSYLVLIGALVVVSRIRPWRAALLILTLSSGLEIVDTAKVRQWVAQQTTEQQPWSIDAGKLRLLTAGQTHLSVWPVTSCTNDRRSIMDALLLASERILYTNAMLMSRGTDGSGCDPRQVLAQPVQPGELRLIVPPAGHNLVSLVPDASAFCRDIGVVSVCSRTIQQHPDLPPVVWDELHAGEHLQFGFGRSGLRFVAAGWATAALSDGIWSEGKEAVLLCAIPEGASRPKRLLLDVAAYAPEKGGEQSISVRVGDTDAGTWKLQDLQATTLTIDLPAANGRAPLTEIRFEIARPTQPASRREWGGTAERGLFLKAMAVE